MSIDDDRPGDSENDSDSAFGNAVLVRGADTGEFPHDVRFGEQGIDDAVAEFGAIVGAYVFGAEDGMVASNFSQDGAHGGSDDVHGGIAE